MQNDAKRRRSKINRKMNLVIVILLLILAIASYWSYEFYEMQKEKNNVNWGYAEEDIDTINEVRDFFLFYFKAEEYGIWLGDLHYTRCMNIVDNSRELLRKYGEIKLDEDKKLVYDEEKRNIKIIQEAFGLDTRFNVDVPLSYYDWYMITCEIATEYGTWVEVDDLSTPPKYVLYLFGNVMDTIEIDDVSDKLYMIDISYDKYGYTGASYKVNTPYYLFMDSNKKSKDYQDYYIYVTGENEWIKFRSVKEIKIEEKYISFIDSNNFCYVYCIEHNEKIYAGIIEENESLSWTYEPVHIYLPDSIDEDVNLKNGLFVKHIKCN